MMGELHILNSTQGHKNNKKTIDLLFRTIRFIRIFLRLSEKTLFL